LLELGLKTLIAYLLGSIVGALVVGQFRGVDIRTLGSGNAGGTNALRTQGLAFAAVTVFIDVGKGWIAARWVPGLAIPGIAADPAIAGDWLTACCGAAAVAGHVWPLWHGFRGGKGGATLAGVLLALAPVLLGIALVAWLLVALLTGYVGLATVTAAAAVAAATGFSPLMTGSWLAFTAAMALLIGWAHRSNFARMKSGTEPRLEKLWLFRPRGPSG
jgi:glycerol-3-phosphate acyltransferase PlsY